MFRVYSYSEDLSNKNTPVPKWLMGIQKSYLHGVYIKLFTKSKPQKA